MTDSLTDCFNWLLDRPLLLTTLTVTISSMKFAAWTDFSRDEPKREQKKVYNKENTNK